MDANERAERREEYALMKRNGLCTRCRKADARPGKIHCQSCATYMYEHQTTPRPNKRRKQRAKHLARGQCHECPRPWKGPRLTCDVCWAKAKARQGKRRGWVGQRPCGFCHELGHYRTTCKKLERLTAEARLLEYASSRCAA